MTKLLPLLAISLTALGQNCIPSCPLSPIPANTVLGNCSGVSAVPGPCAPETLGMKLRRAASVAAANNPYINTPWGQQPAWAPATAYIGGNIVSNGGNLYMCYTPGTSAGSGGPTGTGGAGITDNTVTWYFYGLPWTAIASPPTITTPGSVPGGLTQLFDPRATPAKFKFYGGIVNNTAPSLGVVVEALTISATGNTSCGLVANPRTPLVQCGSESIVFWSDAPKLTFDNVVTGVVSVTVNGQYVIRGVTPPGGHGYTVLDFAGFRAPRKFTLNCNTSCNHAGVWTDPQSKLWPPSTTGDITTVFIGDSITQGGGGFPVEADEAWGRTLSYLMGWANPVLQGIGGAGYIANNAGTTYNFIQHVTDISTFAPNPHVVVISGGLNDPNTGLQAAALAEFQAVRLQAPSAVVIVTGVYPAATGPSAAVLANEASILAAFNQWADPNSYFVPMANDPNGSWITGTGKVSVPTGTGNSDVYTSTDGTHPVENGINFIALHMADAVRKIINSMP